MKKQWNMLMVFLISLILVLFFLSFCCYFLFDIEKLWIIINLAGFRRKLCFSVGMTQDPQWAQAPTGLPGPQAEKIFRGGRHTFDILPTQVVGGKTSKEFSQLKQLFHLDLF